MAKNNETLNSGLFQLLRSRGYQPTMLGTDGKEMPVPEEAEVFQFKFIKDGEDYGPVTLSIDGLHKLVVYFGDNVATSPDGGDTSWYSLLNHLKRFSQKHQLSFEVKNTDHLKYDMAKRTHMKKVDESKTIDSQTKKPVKKLDELSPKLLSKYGTKAEKSADKLQDKSIKHQEKAFNMYNKGGASADKSWDHQEKAEKLAKKSDKRQAGADQAAGKLKKQMSKGNLEETMTVAEEAKWRKGYSASGHPPGFKHKNGDIGPVGGTYTNEPSGYDGETTKVPVQKHRDRPDELANRADTKVSTTGKPLLQKNANKNLKAAIVQSKGKHGPVGVLPESEGINEDWVTTCDRAIKKATAAHKANPTEATKAAVAAARAAKSKKEKEHNKKPKDHSTLSQYNEGVNALAEGYYATGKKSSYSDAVPQVKILLQHSRQLEEGERRYRAIDKIFVENAQGERFAIPTNKPGLARVYARHIAEGGTPYDEHGKHITALCEEYGKMAGFVRATRSKQFNESTQSLVNEGVNHYNNLRETLHKMSGHRGYHAYFESFTPTLTEDEDTTDLSEMFASSELDPRIESVMPILRKLNKNLGEMVETTDLSKWADDIIDEACGQEIDEVSAAAIGHAAEREYAQNGPSTSASSSPTASRPWTLVLNGKVLGTDKNVAVLRALQQKQGGKIVRQGEVAEEAEGGSDERASKIARLTKAAKAITRVERMKKALAADAKTKPAGLKANLEKMLAAQPKKVEEEEAAAPAAPMSSGAGSSVNPQGIPESFDPLDRIKFLLK